MALKKSYARARKQQDRLKPRAAKAIKSRNTSVLPESKRKSTRLQEKSCTTLRLEVGSLSMEKIPDHLVEMQAYLFWNATMQYHLMLHRSERNVTDSPLLRLPGEIRDSIWKFAIGGYDIEIPTQGHFVGFMSQARAIRRNDDMTVEKVESAFRLPEVCRQVHAETVNLAFSLNNFVIICPTGLSMHNECVKATKRWAAQRTMTQLNAITSLEPSTHLVEECCSDMNDVCFKATFPGLKRICVQEDAVDLTAKFNSRHMKEPMTIDEWEEWIDKRLKEREGTNVEAVFRDF